MNSPLDPALTEADTEDSVTGSRSDDLAHYMASLGFCPKEARTKDTLEYAKTYTDPSGKVSRVIMVITKDDVGLEPKEPAYAIVTIQMHLDATDEAVRKKAPAFCRTDLLRILTYFDVRDDSHDIDTRECAFCGLRVAEFVVYQDEDVCLDCARRKGF